MKNFFDLKFILIFSLSIVIYLLYNQLNKFSQRLGLIEINFNNMLEYTKEHIKENEPLNNNQNFNIQNNPLLFNYDLIPDLLQQENIILDKLVEKEKSNLSNDTSSEFSEEESDDISSETSNYQETSSFNKLANNQHDNNQPDNNQPDNNQHDNNQPDNNQHDNNQHDNNQHDNNQPDNNQHDNNQHDNKLNDNEINNNNFENNFTSDTELSEVIESLDDNIVDNTLEEFSNDTDNNDKENNQIYSNDNEDENHTSNMESLEDMTKNINELDITVLLKNNKLIDLQKMAGLLEIDIKHNNGKKKTKLSLAQDIVNKKTI